MVTKVFRTRLTLCQENGLDQDDVLPISVQKEGQHVLFQDWVLGTIGKRKQKGVCAATPHHTLLVCAATPDVFHFLSHQDEFHD